MQNKTQIIYGLPSARINLAPSGIVGTPYEGKNTIERLAMIARGSNPKNIELKAEKPEILINSAIHGIIKQPNQNEFGDNSMGGHLSIKETQSFVLVIICSVAAARQFMRNAAFDYMNEKSNRFSEHSSEYFGFTHIAPVAYLSGKKARQASDKLAPFDAKTVDLDLLAWAHYKSQISKGVAYQDARAILPHNTATEIVINSNIRDLFSLLSQRLFHAAQHEVRFIAHQILSQLQAVAPDLMKYFDFSDAYNIQFFDAAVLKKYTENIALPEGFEAVNGNIVNNFYDFIKEKLQLNRMSAPQDFERLQRDYNLIIEQANDYLATQKLIF
jgi:flavin-dependent thymidylate synthase